MMMLRIERDLSGREPAGEERRPRRLPADISAYGLPFRYYVRACCFVGGRRVDGLAWCHPLPPVFLNNSTYDTPTPTLRVYYDDDSLALPSASGRWHPADFVWISCVLGACSSLSVPVVPS